MKFRSLKRVFAYFCVNHLLAGTRFFTAKRSLLRWAGHEIGDGTKIVGPVFCTGSLKIGRDCWIGRELTVHGNGSVEIGDRCDLAPGVVFLTGGHRIGSHERRAGEGESYSIRVGDGCWIGAGATLMKDITIGAGSVIAACACAGRDIPPDSLAGGVPAKVIRELA